MYSSWVVDAKSQEQFDAGVTEQSAAHRRGVPIGCLADLTRLRDRWRSACAASRC